MKKKELNKWEKEFREVGEVAASSDDRSDIECVISHAAYCLVEECEKAKTLERKRCLKVIDGLRGSQARLNSKLMNQFLEATGEGWLVKLAIVHQEMWEYLIGRVLTKLSEKEKK